MEATFVPASLRRRRQNTPRKKKLNLIQVLEKSEGLTRSGISRFRSIVPVEHSVGIKSYPILDYKVMNKEIKCSEVDEKLKKYIIHIATSRIIHWCTGRHEKSIMYKAVQMFHTYMTWSKLPAIPIGTIAVAIPETVNNTSPLDTDAIVGKFVGASPATRAEFDRVRLEIRKYLVAGSAGPTMYVFLSKFLEAPLDNDHPADENRFRLLVNYIAELSLIKYKLIFVEPSMVAASSIFLARFILWPDENPWNLLLRRVSFYSSSELRECVLKLHRLFMRAQQKFRYTWPALSTSRVPDLYRQDATMQVARSPCSEEIPEVYFEG